MGDPQGLLTEVAAREDVGSPPRTARDRAHRIPPGSQQEKSQTQKTATLEHRERGSDSDAAAVAPDCRSRQGETGRRCGKKKQAQVSFVKPGKREKTQFWLFSHSVTCNSVTPWTAARQASLSITNSRSVLKFTSIGSVMPSNHLILCRPLVLPPSIFSSIRVFSN